MDAGRDVVDADGASDEGAGSGRRRRVVLAPRRWCQVCETKRRRWWPKSPAHQGERAVAVKTIAWGMPGDSGVTCGDYTCMLFSNCMRGCGCIERPAFPAPFHEGRKINGYLAQEQCGEIAEVCVLPSHHAPSRAWWELSLIHISEPTRQAEISYAVF